MMPRTSQRAVLGALLVTALALVLRAPAAAQDGGGEDTILYTIQVGDTCYGIAQRFFGNPRQCHEVIYRYNPHMGSDASNIRPGVTITIPVRNPNAPDGNMRHPNIGQPRRLPLDQRFARHGNKRAQPAVGQDFAGADQRDQGHRRAR